MSTNLDSDRDRLAAATGAQLALSCIGHELSSPLMALYTYLKLAGAGGADDALASIRACVDRVRGITEAARELGRLGDAAGTVELALAVESAATRAGAPAVVVEVSGRSDAAIAPDHAVFVAGAALRAVAHAAASPAPLRARIDRHDGRLHLRIDGGGAEPSSWRPIEPWGPAGNGLDLWAAAVIAGQVGGSLRTGERDGAITVEVELPAAEPR